MFAIILFFALYNSIELDCNERTKIFQEHNEYNANSFYFVKESYSAGEDPYKSNSINNQLFRNTVISKLKCNYKHCINNEWKCDATNQECYHVEHIIPTGHNIPELLGCDVNIFGNLIMAYGKWNNQLSNKYLAEKRIIYGEIFDKAYYNIYYNCKKQPTISNPIADICSSKPAPYVIYIIGLTLFLIAVIIMMLVVIYLSIKQQNEINKKMKYDFDILMEDMPDERV
jgi:hypothetical protein